jgi:hypothetical protein
VAEFARYKGVADEIPRPVGENTGLRNDAARFAKKIAKHGKKKPKLGQPPAGTIDFVLYLCCTESVTTVKEFTETAVPFF